jgi:hypothetical protein
MMIGVDPAPGGWHSAGDLGLFECAEPEPWDRKVEDPQDLEVSASQRAQRERRARERDERDGERRFFCGPPSPRGLARTMIAPPSFDAPERSKPVPGRTPRSDRSEEDRRFLLKAVPSARRSGRAEKFCLNSPGRRRSGPETTELPRLRQTPDRLADPRRRELRCLPALRLLPGELRLLLPLRRPEAS